MDRIKISNSLDELDKLAGRIGSAGSGPLLSTATGEWAATMQFRIGELRKELGIQPVTAVSAKAA